MPDLFIQAFKELGQFFGKKIDELKEVVKESNKTIELDLTTRAIEKLQDTQQLNMNQGVKALERITEGEEKRTAQIMKVISQLEMALASKNTDSKVIAETRDQIKALVSVMKNFDFPTQDIVSALKNVEKQVSKIEIKEPKFDTLEQIMANVLEEIRARDDSKLENKLDAIAEGLRKFNVKIPETFKIDDMQLRKIASSRGASGAAARMEATSQTVANVSMPTAGEEYSYKFPSNTVSFYMKLRAQNADFRYSWTEGDIASGTYMTTAQNFLQSRPGIEISNQTIYFTDPDNNSQVMEIESWQL